MPRVARVAALLLLYCASAAAGRPAVPLLSRLRADRQQQQQQPPLPPRRPGPLRRPAPPQRSPAYPVPLPAINGTAGAVAAVLIALSSNWVVYERLSWLVTALGRWSVGAVRTLFVRTLHFPPTVTLVTMRGLIATDDEMRTGLSYAMLAPEAAPAEVRGESLVNLGRFEKALDRAFSMPGARAVALLIDSPGGSPAQSSLLHRKLLALRRRHPRVKLLAFDSAASGGYYIACAADEIVADANSIVGSIGVISRGFGFVKSLKKKGVERRVHAAGDSKSGERPRPHTSTHLHTHPPTHPPTHTHTHLNNPTPGPAHPAPRPAPHPYPAPVPRLDPYLPMRSADLARQRRLLKELHANFIGAVQAGRKGRLKRDEAALLCYNSTEPRLFASPGRRTLARMAQRGDGLFDGSVYSGAVAQALGLVDGVGEMSTELQRRYGRAVRVVRVEPEAPVDYRRLLRWFL
ncbi:hypothetical protein EMIHUDRAFT_468382 [Emiliania huxleyi CCMP1516]|uniref:Peptidase S49 domain-containing protein n=2 Tax=Emiliania huxleyi TaxID=2903 RepID=A0A0D3K416_EMIH1|nr:hypothetical protein EMIHUDRAFT_468382 [Emiliania huxleyi CCMP1516]EOD30501.1 hypothetical protein EMIHUDRAFT_468382 [Emiliania huxleyi CCMP1516]|eukprot:XP_005782930.1 hypothetical protein EMIHUDRAFT_468382 [Emiliania huxleyi CCMP1516]